MKVAQLNAVKVVNKNGIKELFFLVEKLVRTQ
jgi:hypothetical protein